MIGLRPADCLPGAHPRRRRARHDLRARRTAAPAHRGTLARRARVVQPAQSYDLATSTSRRIPGTGANILPRCERNRTMPALLARHAARRQPRTSMRRVLAAIRRASALGAKANCGAQRVAAAIRARAMAAPRAPARSWPRTCIASSRCSAAARRRCSHGRVSPLCRARHRLREAVNHARSPNIRNETQKSSYKAVHRLYSQK